MEWWKRYFGLDPVDFVVHFFAGALFVGGLADVSKNDTVRLLDNGMAGLNTQQGQGENIRSFSPDLRLLTRGAEAPSEEEQRTNPRSASARLRAAERLATIGAPG